MSMGLPEDQVSEYCSEEAREVDCREVVVEVEDAVHEEEWEVVDCPGTKQLGAGKQVNVGHIDHLMLPNNSLILLVVIGTPSCLEESAGKNNWAKNESGKVWPPDGWTSHQNNLLAIRWRGHWSGPLLGADVEY